MTFLFLCICSAPLAYPAQKRLIVREVECNMQRDEREARLKKIFVHSFPHFLPPSSKVVFCSRAAFLIAGPSIELWGQFPSHAMAEEPMRKMHPISRSPDNCSSDSASIKSRESDMKPGKWTRLTFRTGTRSYRTSASEFFTFLSSNGLMRVIRQVPHLKLSLGKTTFQSP